MSFILMVIPNLKFPNLKFMWKVYAEIPNLKFPNLKFMWKVYAEMSSRLQLKEAAEPAPLLNPQMTDR